LFPHHHSLYTYTAFVKAASQFPLFAGEGDLTARRRELAAFFAHYRHETTKWLAGRSRRPLYMGVIL